MKVSEDGVTLLHAFEGCKLKAYPDPKTGGDPWTIGYGHTGPDVKPGLVWTQEQADAAFRKDLAKFEAGVLALVKVQLNQAQFDALVSFAYNLGLGALGKSTLLKHVNTGRFRLAADQFLLWISKGTPAERGLRRRRAAERSLFMGDTAWRSML